MPRTCSNCGKSGHNRRTCPELKNILNETEKNIIIEKDNIINETKNDEPPVTQDDVYEWFNDQEFSIEESLNLILDRAESYFHCNFDSNMSSETKNIYNWLKEKYDELEIIYENELEKRVNEIKLDFNKISSLKHKNYNKIIKKYKIKIKMDGKLKCPVKEELNPILIKKIISFAIHEPEDIFDYDVYNQKYLN